MCLARLIIVYLSTPIAAAPAAFPFHPLRRLHCSNFAPVLAATD